MLRAAHSWVYINNVSADRFPFQMAALFSLPSAVPGASCISMRRELSKQKSPSLPCLPLHLPITPSHCSPGEVSLLGTAFKANSCPLLPSHWVLLHQCICPWPWPYVPCSLDASTKRASFQTPGGGGHCLWEALSDTQPHTGLYISSGPQSSTLPFITVLTCWAIGGCMSLILPDQSFSTPALWTIWDE